MPWTSKLDKNRADHTCSGSDVHSMTRLSLQTLHLIVASLPTGPQRAPPWGTAGQHLFLVSLLALSIRMGGWGRGASLLWAEMSTQGEGDSTDLAIHCHPGRCHPGLVCSLHPLDLDKLAKISPAKETEQLPMGLTHWMSLLSARNSPEKLQAPRLERRQKHRTHASRHLKAFASLGQLNFVCSL